MKRVVIHIDHLVLNGFRHEDQRAIALGLQEKLEQAFGDRETIARLVARGDAPRLQVGNVHIQRGTNPKRVGANVAGGIRRSVAQ